MKKYFTSESVTEGHPDKICDQIADAILDELLKQDSNSRCACEVIAEKDSVHIMGEITTTAKVDYTEIARDVIKRIGYTKPEYGFDYNCKITCSVHNQSSDIAVGVDKAFDSTIVKEINYGAGDQGMMFGYACDETPELMPMPIMLAHSLTKRLAEVRKRGIIKNLRPDGKAQVTIEYDNEVPIRIDTVVVSTQHDEDFNINQLRKDIKSQVIEYALPISMMDNKTKIYINPTGRFVYGGPCADTGLTGRKIIVDTYGGYSLHGGGSFSGKDCTKVDRSAAYMARNIAKTIVAAGVAKRCEVQLSYAIGLSRPISIYVNTFGTCKINEYDLQNWITKTFDLRPIAIIKKLDLRKPIYQKTASYGHFGRDEFSWENVDKSATQSLKCL